MARAKSRAPKRASAAKGKRATAKRTKPARAAKKAGAASKAKKAKRVAAPKKKAAKAAKPSPARRKPAKRTASVPKPAASAPKPAAKQARKAAAPKAVVAAKAKTTGKVNAAPDPAASRTGRAPTLDRERRRATDPDLVPTPPSSLDMDRSASAARSGRAELAHKLQQHTSTGPGLTAGDVDADWESADSVGDEAPGGDNPTPDQDVVDEIGRSLGVEYDDDEELQGGAEIESRDRKRWELDPASADDFDERED